jgi:hypothetical protein
MYGVCTVLPSLSFDTKLSFNTELLFDVWRTYGVAVVVVYCRYRLIRSCCSMYGVRTVLPSSSFIVDVVRYGVV